VRQDLNSTVFLDKQADNLDIMKLHYFFS